VSHCLASLPFSGRWRSSRAQSSRYQFYRTLRGYRGALVSGNPGQIDADRFRRIDRCELDYCKRNCRPLGQRRCRSQVCHRRGKRRGTSSTSSRVRIEKKNSIASWNWPRVASAVAKLETQCHEARFFKAIQPKIPTRSCLHWA